jgi:hypothetical protein
MADKQLNYSSIIAELDSQNQVTRDKCAEQLNSGDTTYDQALRYLIEPANSDVAMVIDKVGDFNVILDTVYHKLNQYNVLASSDSQTPDTEVAILESLWDDIHTLGGDNIKFLNESDFKQFVESNQFPFDNIFALVQVNLRNMVVKSLCDESPLVGDDAYSVVLKGLWQHLYAKADENQSYRCLDSGISSGEDFSMADIDWM